MNPTLSGFALGLLFGAAKIGLIGTIGFGIAWWRTRSKLKRLEAELPDPAQLNERLTNLEQLADYTAAQVNRLAEEPNAPRLSSPGRVPPSGGAGSGDLPSTP